MKQLLKQEFLPLDYERILFQQHQRSRQGQRPVCEFDDGSSRLRDDSLSTPMVEKSKPTPEIQGGVIDKKVEEDEIICEPDGEDEYYEEECYEEGDGVDLSLSVPVPDVLPPVFTFDAIETFRYPYVHLPVIHSLYYDALMGLRSMRGYCDCIVPMECYEIFVGVHWSIMDGYLY